MSWTQKTLGEIVNLKRGFDLPSSSRVDGPYPVFSSSGQTGTHSEAAVKGPCVVTGRYGTIGQVFFSDAACWPLNTSLYSTDFKGNDPKFVYYLLKTIPWRDYLTASAVPGINRNHVHLCPVCVPDHETQTAISGVLGLLDNKIELNTKLNGYLEEWGQSYLENYQKSCVTTIPLRNVMDFGNGYAFKSEAYIQSGLYKILTIKNVQDGSVDCSTSNRIDELPPKMKSFCKLQPGNVVLSLTGNVGRVGIVSEENCLLNQRVAVLQPYNYALLPGLYFHFRQKAFQNEMVGIAKGTAQANLSPVETLKLEMPYNESFLDISQKLKPSFDLILANTIESKRLTVLRDALLPKLMSGEIDVSKVDLKQLNSHLA